MVRPPDSGTPFDENQTNDNDYHIKALFGKGSVIRVSRPNAQTSETENHGFSSATELHRSFMKGVGHHTSAGWRRRHFQEEAEAVAFVYDTSEICSG